MCRFGTGSSQKLSVLLELFSQEQTVDYLLEINNGSSAIHYTCNVMGKNRCHFNVLDINFFHSKLSPPHILLFPTQV